MWTENRFLVSWQFIRFSSVGVVNTSVGLFVIFGTKVFLNDNDIIANAAGYTTGLIVSFLLNKSWTFRDVSSLLESGFRFLSVFAISYTINLVTVLVCIHWIGVNPYLAQALGVLPYTIMFFLLCKYFAFRLHDECKI